MGFSDSQSQNRPGVEYLLAQVISILTLESPSQPQLEQALALSGEIISRARETREWFRTEVFGRVNAATALLDLGQPLEAKDEVLLALQKASGFSLSAEDRIKALALLGACEKALNNWMPPKLRSMRPLGLPIASWQATNCLELNSLEARFWRSSKVGSCLCRSRFLGPATSSGC